MVITYKLDAGLTYNSLHRHLSIWTSRTSVVLCLLITKMLTTVIGQGWHPSLDPAKEGAGSCWTGGFSKKLCCDMKHGPSGNSNCWGGSFTFEKCCINNEVP